MCADLPSRAGLCGHSLLHVDAHLVPHSLQWPGCHPSTSRGRGSWARAWGPTPRQNPCHHLTQPFGSWEDPLKGCVRRLGAQSLGSAPSSHQQGPPTCPRSDRHTDRRIPGEVGWSLFLGGPGGVAKQTVKGSPAHGGGFHWPLPSPSFPTHSLGSPPTPHFPAGRGVRLPLTILGAAGQTGSKAGRTESPGPGPTLSPKSRAWNVGHLWAPPSRRRTPMQNIKQASVASPGVGFQCSLSSVQM